MKDKFRFDNFSAGMKLATTAAFIVLSGLGGTAIWRASSQTARVDMLEKESIQTKKSMDDTARFVNDTNGRLIRLETELGHIKEKQEDWKEQYDNDIKELKNLIRQIP